MENVEKGHTLAIRDTEPKLKETTITAADEHI